MVSNYIIIADSCVDLTKEQRAAFKIEYPIVGKIYFPDGRSENADPDWNNISYEEYYKMMAKKMVFKSAMPNEYEVSSRFEEYLEKGLDIIAICLSSKMSGTYEQFLNAKTNLENKYPNRKIFIVDSLKYSSAIGLLAVYASINRDKGMTIDENYEWLNEQRFHLHQAGILDDLFFLSRSGRIPKISAIMGTMVGVKPVADFCNETGMPYVIGKGRGYKKSFKALEQYIKKTIGSSKDKVFIVNTSARDKQATELKNIIEYLYHPKHLLMTRVGEGSGANVGPGLCCVYYLADERISENCEKEKKIITEILVNENR